MNILLNSLLVLSKEWQSILSLLSLFLLGGGVAFLYFKIIFGGQFTIGEYLVLGMGGALLPVLLAIILASLLDFILGVKINIFWICLIFFCACFLVNFWSGGWGAQTQSSKIFALILIIIVIFSVFIRLAFISGLLVPLYFDSAMHYSIIQGLITNLETSTLPSFGSFVGGYYHLGFHVLVAGISLALQVDARDAILIFGQIILAVLPLPVFFIIKQETTQDTPAIFATLLAGWGWYMPAHAVDWGKYPALTSILIFEFVLCVVILALKAPINQRWKLIGLSGLSILVSTFIHTRSLVLIIIMLASWLLATGWYRLPSLIRNLLFVLISVGLATLVIIIQSKPVLRLALDPYQGQGIWITLVVLSLSPFALKKYPQAAFSCILAIFILSGSLFISVTSLFPVYEAQTLLDRPLVESVLFLPLALLGGLGYAGLLRSLKGMGLGQVAGESRANILIMLFLFGGFFVNFTQYNFYPSECCKLFGEQDAVAFDWMDRNLPPNASILIAAFEAVVFESNQSAGYAGSDAGIWIMPLIRRNVLSVPYQTDFSTQGALNEICKGAARYVYAGETAQSFNIKQFEDKPEWFARLYALSKIRVYKVIGCP